MSAVSMATAELDRSQKAAIGSVLSLALDIIKASRDDVATIGGVDPDGPELP